MHRIDWQLALFSYPKGPNHWSSGNYDVVPKYQKCTEAYQDYFSTYKELATLQSATGVGPFKRIRMRLKSNISQSENWDYFFNRGPDDRGHPTCFRPNENDKGNVVNNIQALPSSN